MKGKAGKNEKEKEMNPLKELLELANKLEDLERQTLKTVAKARAEKHSWQAIANMIGGTRQAAQQRYGKAIEPLMEQGKYECSCGWTMVYPGWEAEEAADDIADHRDEHDREDERDDYGTEPADLDQLPAETAIFLDGTAPAPKVQTPAGPVELGPEDFGDEFAGAHATADRILAAERARKSVVKPLRTDAPQVDRDADETMNRIESGELDTEGFTIDWTQKNKNGVCAKCSMTHHYEGKGRNLYFWIGPQCNPTYRDTTQYKG